MLRKWITKKLSISDEDEDMKAFRRRRYARRHTVDVEALRGATGAEETTSDQAMMAAALVKYSKSYEDDSATTSSSSSRGGYRRLIKSASDVVVESHDKASSTPASAAAAVRGRGRGSMGAAHGRRTSSAAVLKSRLETVPSTECPPDEDSGEEGACKETAGPGGGKMDAGGKGEGEEKEGGKEGGKEGAEVSVEIHITEEQSTEAEKEGEGKGSEGAGINPERRGQGGLQRGGQGGGQGGGAVVKLGPGRASGLRRDHGTMRSWATGGSFKRRSLRRSQKSQSMKKKKNGMKIDLTQPLLFPTTPETILEYHNQKPILDPNEEWLVVELNEFECLVDSLDVIRLIAKHSKFFEVSPDELWEEFFEFVDTVPSYDEVVNFDVWQEFRDKRYSC